MLSLRLPFVRSLSATTRRSVVTTTIKPAGDISSVFPSLSGVASAPLHPRFASLKREYLDGRENDLQSGWERLVGELKREVEEVKELGGKVCFSFFLLSASAYTDKNNTGYPIYRIQTPCCCLSARDRRDQTPWCRCYPKRPPRGRGVAVEGRHQRLSQGEPKR